MPRVMIVQNDCNYFLRHRLPIARELLRRSVTVHVMAGGKRIVPPVAETRTFKHFEIERFRFNLKKDIALAAKIHSPCLNFPAKRNAANYTQTRTIWRLAQCNS
jgi:hypothetical protein